MTISVEMVSTSSKLATVYLSCPPPGGLFSIYQNANYGLSYKVKKHASPIQLPRPSILRGGLFFCFIFLHNRHMNILQRIFTDYYEEIKYTLHPSLTPYVFLLCPYQEPYYQTFCSSYDHLNQIQYLRFQR